MNDLLIRQSFHKKMLRRYHSCKNTLVVDELGLKHGKCRADIAVINGYLHGFEIKSDNDSLCRLGNQAEIYSLVFDRATMIVGTRHTATVTALVPEWWGIIVCTQGSRGAVTFKTVRRTKLNKSVDPISVAELLWRDEVADILRDKGMPPRILRQKRSVLYEYLNDLLTAHELCDTVKDRLKKRKNWRCPE
jgi:hypothetical protein